MYSTSYKKNSGRDDGKIEILKRGDWQSRRNLVGDTTGVVASCEPQVLQLDSDFLSLQIKKKEKEITEMLNIDALKEIVKTKDCEIAYLRKRTADNDKQISNLQTLVLKLQKINNSLQSEVNFYKNQRREHISRKNKVILFGDVMVVPDISIRETYFMFNKRTWSYVNLQQMIDQIFKFYINPKSKKGFKLVIIHCGTNSLEIESKQITNVREITKDLVALLDMTSQFYPEAKIAFSGIIYRKDCSNSAVDELNAVMREECERREYLFIDANKSIPIAEDDLSDQGLGFSSVGINKFRQFLIDEINSCLFPRRNKCTK